MGGLIDLLFSPVNIILTLLLILLLVYWLFNMIAGLDFDVDVDVDIDIDADVDIDVDSAIEGSNIDFQDIANTEVDKEAVVGKKRTPLKWWQVVLIYFNFVELPFMFTFTFWIFIWWLCTSITTSITYSYENYLGFVFLLVLILPSLIITKIVTTPFKKFFKTLKQDGDSPIDLLGRTGKLNGSIEKEELGLVEITAESKTLSIYAKSLDGSFIDATKDVLIIKQSADKNYYYIKTYNN